MIRLHCTKKLPLQDNGRLRNQKPNPYIANDDDRESPLSGWLAERPCMLRDAKDCIWPIRAMETLLRADSAANAARGQADIA